MTPVFQQVFEDDRGDCFAACLASVLDLPLASVPNFRQLQEETGQYDMIMEADKWLRSNCGKRFISIEMYDCREGPTKGHCLTDQVLCNRLFNFNQNELVILSGESPRKRSNGGTKYHCVIARADCWGFELVHDPHPDGGGIVGEPYGVKWIVPV
jgi:hypothetical protein